MSYLAGLLEGIDERRREERQRRYDEESRTGDIEFKILTQLAQSDDDEIAALAGTGLLESIAGGGRPKKAKGLQGFLGDMSRSSYLPAISATLQARRGAPPTPAIPGGAALPAGSPVEPGGPRMAPGMTGAAAAGPPPRLEGATGGLNTLGMTDDFGGDVFPSDRAPLPAVPSFQMPSGPEAPQARYQRLFPSAAETAANVQAAELMAKFQSILTGLQLGQQIGGPVGDLLTRATMGQAGAPLPNANANSMVTATMPDGSEVVGIYDTYQRQLYGENGQPIVGAVAIRPFKQTRRTFQEREVDQASGKQWLVTKDADTGKEISRSMTGDAPRAQAPEYSGTATAVIDGRPVVVQPSRTGGTPNIIGGAPPKSGGTGSPKNTPQAIQAQAWSTELKRRVESLKASMPNLGALGRPSVKPEQIDAMTRELTGGQYASAVDLEIAARGGTPPPPPPPKSKLVFGPDGAARIREALKNRTR